MRGALRPAALLLERAAQLTPPDRQDEAVRRAVDAAYLHFEAGDSRRAEAKLRDVIAPLPPGPQRARALVRARAHPLYEAPDEARELFLQVVDEAEGDARPSQSPTKGSPPAASGCSSDSTKRSNTRSIALALARELGRRGARR